MNGRERASRLGEMVPGRPSQPYKPHSEEERGMNTESSQVRKKVPGQPSQRYKPRNKEEKKN